MRADHPALRGGATIDISRKPLPPGTLDEIVDVETTLDRYDSKSTLTVGGSPAIRVTYSAEIPPDYFEKDVGVYVAQGSHLYFFHMVYNANDTEGESGYLSTLNSVLNSVKFTGTVRRHMRRQAILAVVLAGMATQAHAACRDMLGQDINNYIQGRQPSSPLVGAGEDLHRAALAMGF